MLFEGKKKSKFPAAFKIEDRYAFTIAFHCHSHSIETAKLLINNCYKLGLRNLCLRQCTRFF